jgi:hypothetical protein
MSELLLDRAGRRRSPATMPGFHAGRPPRNKGLRYPADPPKVEEIVAVMRTAGDRAHGRRLRSLIVILWRAGLRSRKRSLSRKPISITAAVRCSFVAARADVVARSAWTRGAGRSSSRGSSCESSFPSGRCSASSTVRHAAGIGAAPPRERTCAGRPSQRAYVGALRRTGSGTPHAVEMAREGVPLIVIQRQLGHSNLGITSVYLQGIDNAEIIEAVHTHTEARMQGLTVAELEAALVDPTGPYMLMFPPAPHHSSGTNTLRLAGESARSRAKRQSGCRASGRGRGCQRRAKGPSAPAAAASGPSTGLSPRRRRPPAGRADRRDAGRRSAVRSEDRPL